MENAETTKTSMQKYSISSWAIQNVKNVSSDITYSYTYNKPCHWLGSAKVVDTHHQFQQRCLLESWHITPQYHPKPGGGQPSPGVKPTDSQDKSP